MYSDRREEKSNCNTLLWGFGFFDLDKIVLVLGTWKKFWNQKIVEKYKLARFRYLVGCLFTFAFVVAFSKVG